jgi:S1-C subfamily serine protease
MIKRILTSLISAIIGGLIVWAGLTFYQQPQKIIKRQIITTSKPKISVQKKGSVEAEEIYKKFSPAVVNVSAISNGAIDFFGQRIAPEEQAIGSGFLISEDGLIVTNEHVVENADQVKVTLASKKEVSAKVLGTDRSTDLALLKIKLGNEKITPLKLGNSANVQVGEPVYAIGNPLGLQGSMSAGIVSALNRQIDAPNGFQIRGVIQTDAAINRGNSGGPLISPSGSVIGVTAQIATEPGSPGNIGIAFAIPSNTVKKVANQILKEGKVSHAWLGVAGRTVTSKLASELNLPVKYGALIINIFAGGPADKAGLKGTARPHTGLVGDIIVKLAGKKVDSMEKLVDLVDSHKPGDKVSIAFYRGKKLKRTTVTLKQRPEKIR